MITDSRANKIRDVYSKRQKDLAVVLENVWDPHNVSAVFRSCDAVGIDAVYLVYPDKKFPSLADSSSASASKWVKAEKFISIDECYKELRKKGFSIWSTGMGEDGKQTGLYDLELSKPTALVFGNEKDGLTAEAVEKSDGNFLIPMVGMVQSLNISVSVAVCVYEAMRQRLISGQYDKAQYSEKEIEKRVEEVAWEKANKRLKNKR